MLCGDDDDDDGDDDDGNGITCASNVFLMWCICD